MVNNNCRAKVSPFVGSFVLLRITQRQALNSKAPRLLSSVTVPEFYTDFQYPRVWMGGQVWESGPKSRTLHSAL